MLVNAHLVGIHWPIACGLRFQASVGQRVAASLPVFVGLKARLRIAPALCLLNPDLLVNR
jgi:hypothetical protein